VGDHGLLPPDSVARRVDREMFLLGGGAAALLMQVAHPLVAASVDQHSDFRRSPHRRLLRTLDTTLAIVFGDMRHAIGAVDRINARHVPVHGASATGIPYSARDPRLLLWVQCTLILTSLRLYELVMGRLSAGDRQRYWDEGKLIAARLGIPGRLMPETIGDLEAYEREMLASEVIPDETSRAVGRDVIRPYRFLPGAATWPIDALTAGLLPPSLREPFGLRWGAAERLTAAWLTRTWLAWRRVLPPSFRQFRQARDAERRAR
jgi:uncharacterized protein (DUF2236 family)